MTKKTLELLESSPSNINGFVALIESARIDMSEHSNDVATLAHEGLLQNS
jgi:alkaline phosphatase